MGRKRKGRPVHGWLAIDKDIGITSTQAVGRARRLLDAQKAGHAGTLDPLATGVLPIALGEATKTVPYVMDGAKTYRFTARFGEARDTDDLEGRILETNHVRPDDGAIRSALNRFTGVISQVPPLYSAVKIQGERSYKRARSGQEELPPARNVEIDRFELIDRPDSDHALFEVDCGKGTYIRSLARDLGRDLGTVAYVAELRRTRCGPFDEKDAILLDTLAESVLCAPPQECLLPVTTALDDIPALAVDSSQAARLKQGQSVIMRGRDAPIAEDPVLVTWRGKPVAIAAIEGGVLKSRRVFNLN